MKQRLERDGCRRQQKEANELKALHPTPADLILRG